MNREIFQRGTAVEIAMAMAVSAAPLSVTFAVGGAVKEWSFHPE